MRVLALGPESYGGFGGIAQGTRDFLDGLFASGRIGEIDLLPRLPCDGGPKPRRGLNELAAPCSSLAYGVEAFRLAFTHRYDLIFCLHINLAPLAVALKRLLGIPVWMAIHGIDAWTPPDRYWRRIAARHVDLVSSSSRYTRERFLDWCPLPAEQAYVNTNPVHLENFAPGPKPEELVQRYGLEGRKVLLTVGRMLGGDRLKGHDAILDVFPGLIRRHPDLAWLIVGDGADRDRLQKRAKSMPEAERIVFAGRIPEEEKEAHYRVADAYALPSKTEGFGIAYVEAAACGLPVLGSSLDGSRDALADGALGLLVDPDDSKELLEGLSRLLCMPKELRSQVASFSFGAMASRMEKLLERVVPLGEAA